jgi:hypothetical protein
LDLANVAYVGILDGQRGQRGGAGNYFQMGGENLNEDVEQT